MTLLSSSLHGHLLNFNLHHHLCYFPSQRSKQDLLPDFKATRTHTTGKIKAYSGSVHSLSEETVTLHHSQMAHVYDNQTPHLASDSLSQGGAFTHLEKFCSFSSVQASVISFFSETFIIPFLLVPFFKHPDRNLLLSSKHFVFTSCSKAQLLY